MLIHKAVTIVRNIYILALFTFLGALGRQSEGGGGGRGSNKTTGTSLLHTTAVVAQDFALLAQMLRVLLALVGNVQPIGFL